MAKCPLISVQGRARTFSLISCLLCLSLLCKSLGLAELSALIFGNKAFSVACIQSGSWRKGERQTVLPNAEISNRDAGMQFH